MQHMSKSQALIGGLVLLTICSLLGFLDAASKEAPLGVLRILGGSAIAFVMGAIYVKHRSRMAH